MGLQLFQVSTAIHPTKMQQQNSNMSALQRSMTTDSNANMDATSIYSEHDKILMPSKDGSKDGSQPGFASEQSLSRGLQIPSKTARLSSGFEYPSILGTNYNISKEDWTQFTNEITKSAKLSSSQWRTVIGAGMGVMAVGGSMIGVFGAVPAVIVSKKIRERTESRNLAKAMGMPSPFTSPKNQKDQHDSEDRQTTAETESSNDENSLSYKLKQWNETFFQPRGIMIRIDMPYDLSALHDGISVADTTRARKRASGPLWPSSSRQGSVSSAISDKSDSIKDKYKASERCRIVIIPFSNGGPQSVMSTATTLAGESPYTPAFYE